VHEVKIERPRKSLLRPTITLIFGILCVLPTPFSVAYAQGTAEDYKRAESLGKRTGGGVVRAAVRPRWLGSGARFWYQNSLPGGRSEFLLVDPDVPAKRPAFDHARLAVALSIALGRTVHADRLPVESIRLLPGTFRLGLRADGRAFDYDPDSNTLRAGVAGDAAASPDPGEGRARPLHPSRAPASRGGSEEVYLTFRNATTAAVSLFWIDTEGGRRPYGTLAAGEVKRQHTFVGHTWLIAGSDGAPLVAFTAPDRDAQAVIDGGRALPERPERPAPPAGTRAGVSPDGRWKVVVREHNVFLQALPSGTETRLSHDGTADDAYEGQAYWSPNSRRVVVMKTAPAQERKVHLVESAPRDQPQPKLHVVDYLKPGDRIAHPRPCLFDIAEKRAIPVSDALFPTPWSIDDLRWDADGKRFTFLYYQRGHQVLRLIAVDAATGVVTPVIEEKATTFIDWTNKVYLHRLGKTGEALWMSERSGWNHLYLYDAAAGRVKNPVTRGPWVVRAVDRVDEEKRQVWFRACGIIPGQDPYYVHFCRVNFDGSGLTLLTEGDGTHAAVAYSPDGRYLVDTYSRVDLPPVTELRRVADGKKVLDLERGDASALLATGWRYPERFVAKGRDGETNIYGVILRPTNFDPARKYPVIEDIYAGPQGAFAPKSFSAVHGGQALAELGFVVVRIDGMGTNWRSKAFHDVSWKNLADAGLPDRILWMKAAASKYPEMDLTWVGIYGTSAGGQNALGALLLHSEFYKVGVADCGCHDNRMDKLWWNEQWMGWPVGPEYAAQSNVTLAPRLQGKLLLMVGEMDRNVDPASTMQVVDALVRADKDFDLLVAPGVGHGVLGTPYGRRRLFDFFVRHLLGVTPRGSRLADTPVVGAPH
jgi:dipeptidyl aminopeptidase/acylaminoacyl peptidase